MRNHALSCEIMSFQAEPCNSRSWYCLDVPSDFGRISQRRKGPTSVCLCCPHSTDLSVAASRAWAWHEKLQKTREEKRLRVDENFLQHSILCHLVPSARRKHVL